MLEDLIDDRLKKLKEYQEKENPYPSQSNKDKFINEILNSFNELKEDKSLYITGRIMGWRDQGGIIFADLKDSTGEIQVVLNEDDTNNFNLLQNTVDLGDFLEVKGILGETNRGEKSLMAKDGRIVSKSLRPWPSTWFGIENDEERYRKRYLDFVYNEESKEKILTRFKAISEIRNILEEEDFIEVETPILQPLPGGALAAPFETHFNALDLDVYLRIAKELYLKRLLVGGFEKIFEIGKDFRNEGIDREHYPEFTMLELYWTFQDYEGLMNAIERWIKELVNRLGIEKITFEGEKIDFFKDWPKVKYIDLIKEYSPEDVDKINTSEIDDVFKKKVRPNIKNPIFVIDHPKSISPLSKSHEGDKDFTERFQLIAAETELVNGFSELNDPIDQRERMEKQEEMFRGGDEEASRLDEDFLQALEYGMPPTSGLGIGIDRLVAFITDTHNIRDIIPFTTIKPKD